ncbi:MAG TPA: polysaccharide biosynthesis tyrosine autokinase [Candidatus Polarisedimenticolia bacterium]|nr:polysaccharide biosynthesis tyrosine autokinase [Candidatus Polarisedimenticolia bacterium]
MSPDRPESERQAHLRDYWRIVWAGRRTIGSVFVIVVTIGILATYLATPVYRATATLEINPRTQRVVKVDDVSQIGATGMGWSAEDRYFRTQLEVLRSRDVAQRAFESLGLDGHPLFQGTGDPVARFMARLDVEPTPDTLIVSVSAESSDPADAALWVNHVAESYVRRNFEQARRATADAIAALDEQMKPLREKLLSREAEKFDYARSQQVFVPDTQKLAYNERLISLGKSYTETKLRRLELEAVFRKIEEIDRAGGDYFVIPQVAKDDLLRGLLSERGEIEAEQRRILVSLKPGHTKVKENEAALQKVNQRIQAETSRIIGAIRTDYALAESKEADLDSEIRRTYDEALTMSQKSSTYDILNRESEEARKVLDLVMQRLKEVDLNASLLRNNLDILDRAIVPTSPVRPRPMINLIVSVLMGLGLGVGLVFFLEYLDDTIRGVEHLETELGLTVLAVVPRRSEASEAAVREAFSSLRTGVQFCSMSRARRVLLVTSPGPEEGKSLTAFLLAGAMARAGERVCLVDADLRRPSLDRLAGLPAGRGLSHHLADPAEVPLRSVVRGGGPGEPHVITAGALPPSPAELLASERFGLLIGELKGSYDWVIVDSPPAAGLADAVLLAAQTDMVLLIARQSRTRRDALRRAAEAVRAANPNIIGAVLNDVDLRRAENRELYYPAIRSRAAAAPAPEPPVRQRPAAL